jgi:HEPN domain-containing protein
MGTGDASEWLRHAESHLNYAKLGRDQTTILPNQVAFHAQQAAEKALKAVLVGGLVEFPRTHDLQELLILIAASGISVQSEFEQLIELSRFAVETRYPGDFEPITPDEIQRAIELADKAVAWARVLTHEFPKHE